MSAQPCPDCGCQESRVLETRGPRRRRRCTECGYRWSTIEAVAKDETLDIASDATSSVDISS